MSEVENTAELRRVLALPRRTPSDLDALAAELTALLSVTDRCPGKADAKGLCEVCRSPMSLFPVQALALHDLGIEGGALLPVGVGEGKTLIFWLCAYVLGASCVLGLLPASLIKNAEDARALFSNHWRIPKHVRLFSYELLGRPQSEKELENPNFQPDLIVCDEVHRLKNLRAACTRRVARYMAKSPRTGFAGMSGTIMRDSLHDFAHLAFWALKEKAPLPMNARELDEWAAALDEPKPGNPNANTHEVSPGALLLFANDEERKKDERTAARLGFRRRLMETQGIVVANGQGEDVGASIQIKSHFYDIEPLTEAHFATLRKSWERPDGKAFEQGVEVWSCARQLALGFHYEWDPPPPDDWMAARKEWSKFVRGVLSHSRTMDSPEVVVRAIDAGRVKEGATLLERWRAIKPTFRPRTVVVWHDDSALKWCTEWMKDGGIVWTEHDLFARRLSMETGAPYFGAKGFSADGEYIQASKAKAIIASIDANRDGKDLQTQGWERMLFTSLPDGWDAVQQAIARIHRKHYRGDHVDVDWLLGCREHWSAWTKVCAGTEAARDTIGAKPKLLLADIDVPSEDEIEALHGPRW